MVLLLAQRGGKKSNEATITIPLDKIPKLYEHGTRFKLEYFLVTVLKWAIIWYDLRFSRR
jgi:hypothetical protein